MWFDKSNLIVDKFVLFYYQRKYCIVICLFSGLSASNSVDYERWYKGLTYLVDDISKSSYPVQVER